MSQVTPIEKKEEPIEEFDTIIIYKDPYVIRNQIYIPPENKTYNKFIEVYFSPLYYLNYYNACPECQTSFDKLKSVTEPLLGYSLGLGFTYLKKRMYYNSGISYSIIREKFYDVSYNNSKSVNHYNYIDLNLSAGYKIGKGKLFTIFSLNGIISKSIVENGKTISLNDSLTVGLKDQNIFKSWNYSIGISSKLNFAIKDKILLFAEPFYRANLFSITKRSAAYVQYRHFIGIRMGLSYGF